MRWHHYQFNGLSPLLKWNPQLFREVKGRLTPRNVALTGLASLLLQSLFLLGRISLLPKQQVKPFGNHYCTGPEFDGMGISTCLKDSADNLMVNWQAWWFDIYRLLSWSLPLILLMAGTYLLLEDLGRELRRGTLNFIRTSPQSSDRILLGKVLGVPALIYLAVALMLPLHLWAASQGKIPAYQVLSLYLFTLTVCAFAYAGALVLAFIGGGYGWLGLIVVSINFCLFLPLWRSGGIEAQPSYLGINHWYGLEVGSHLHLALPFAMLFLSMGTFRFWQAANRRYRNPQATLWNKTQSYWMTAGLEIWLLGFFVPGSDDGSDLFSQVVQIGLMNLIWFIGLIAALTPQRQAVLDWVRYRHYTDRPGLSHSPTSGQRSGQRSWLQDLFCHEKSPALLAIGLNLAVALALVGLWLLTTETSQRPLVPAILALALLGLVQLLIMATIVQTILLSKLSRRTFVATSSLIGLVLLPPLTLSLLAISPSEMPLPWLFTITSLTAVKFLVFQTFGVAFLAQVIFLAFVGISLAQKLQRISTNQEKRLPANIFQ